MCDSSRNMDNKNPIETVKQVRSMPTPVPSSATSIFPKWLREIITGFSFTGFRGANPHELYDKTLTVATLREMCSDFDQDPSQSDGDWFNDVFKKLDNNGIQGPLGKLTDLNKKDLPHLPTKVKYANLICPPHQSRLGWAFHTLPDLPAEVKIVTTAETVDKMKQEPKPKITTFLKPITSLEETKKSGDGLAKKPSESD